MTKNRKKGQVRQRRLRSTTHEVLARSKSAASKYPKRLTD